MICSKKPRDLNGEYSTIQLPDSEYYDQYFDLSHIALYLRCLPIYRNRLMECGSGRVKQKYEKRWPKQIAFGVLTIYNNKVIRVCAIRQKLCSPFPININFPSENKVYVIANIIIRIIIGVIIIIITFSVREMNPIT